MSTFLLVSELAQCYIWQGSWELTSAVHPFCMTMFLCLRMRSVAQNCFCRYGRCWNWSKSGFDCKIKKKKCLPTGVFWQVFQSILLKLGPQPSKGKNAELPPALVEETVSHMMSACAAYTNREQARHMWTTLLVSCVCVCVCVCTHKHVVHF